MAELRHPASDARIETSAKEAQVDVPGTTERQFVKIILSRKGFDSENGGVASPIFPDGRLHSLPIPAGGSPARFSQLSPGGVMLGPLVEQLTKGKVPASTRTHLDPDLNHSSRPRPDGWQPAFGQTGAAQGHLSNEGVGDGDIFLFFGWFRRVVQAGDSWQFSRGAPNLHVLFGWLQVGQILPVGAATDEYRARHPGLRDHPHMYGRREASNTIYVASTDLAIPGLPVLPGKGAGVFQSVTDELVLTAPGQTSRRLWQLPSWMRPSEGRKPLTYHGNPDKWSTEGEHVRLVSAAKGQEFVLDCQHYAQASTWVHGLLRAHG